MKDFSIFMKENVKRPQNEHFAPSERIVDADGNPVEWEIRAITSDEDDKLINDCQIKVPVPGRKGAFTYELDKAKYIGKFAVACTVYPDLNDQNLQDSYGVMGADKLLKVMLLPGEYAEYIKKVQEICGYDNDINDLVDEVKNS